MGKTRRRYWVYLLLFVFNVIAYLDRINMSVAGKAIAQDLDLSPVALGYLYSSFLWAYVAMMLPVGPMIDRWGGHAVAAVSTTVWSIAQMLTGTVGSFSTMLLTRLGLGAGEAPFAPITYRAAREWSPYTERGTTVALIQAGTGIGPAIGAPIVAWLIQSMSWRWSFVVTGAIGLVWVAVWVPLVSTVEKTRWITETERRHILATRDAGVPPPSHGPVGFAVLLRAPAMWGLFFCQGGVVYSTYLYLTWLPTYLQTAQGVSLLGSGFLTALPFFISAVGNIIVSWIGDRVMSADAVRSGKRNRLLALCLALTGAGILIPHIGSLAGVIAAISIAVTFAHAGSTAAAALTNDLLRSPADAGRAFAFLVLGGNAFGMLAPIVTGYVVRITGSFSGAFTIAGCLGLIGVVIALVFCRGAIGDVQGDPSVAVRPV